MYLSHETTYEQVATKSNLDRIKSEIEFAMRQKYSDFYLDNGTEDAEVTIERILTLFGNPEEQRNHKRYVYMGYAIALASFPTAQTYMKNDDRFELILTDVQKWLQDKKTQLIVAENWFDLSREVRGNDSITDTIYLFYYLIKSLSWENAYDSLVEILYVSLLGDAINPLPQKRRDVFNWWLTSVVPASYSLRLATFGV